jgi:hypothetical protein
MTPSEVTPSQVMSATTAQVRKVIEQVLKIEKSYKHIQNLSANKSVEAKISEEILRVITQEIQ